jgi:Cu+-exporting ATPase
VPVDGVIIEGGTSIDESMLTGESMPAEKETGDQVTGGNGQRHRRRDHAAERVGSSTMLARIVSMVAEAQRSRAPIQALADRVSAVFVPPSLRSRRSRLRCGFSSDRSHASPTRSSMPSPS